MKTDYTRIKIIAGIVSSLIILNLVVLDIFIVRNTKNLFSQYISPQTTSTSQTTAPSPISDQSCSIGCLNQIKEATASIKLESLTSALPPAKSTSTGVKEFFVPIGSGSTSKDEWDDIDGLEVWVDKSKYGNIKSAVFEASVRVPTKNQWVDVRLYNVTDKHPVWFSEVRFPGGSDPTLVVSDPIVLDSGNKLYKVQMKAQLRFDAFLDQSRIHITTD